MFNEYNDVLTVEELCEILHIGNNSAYKLLGSGEIKAFQFGRTWKIPKFSVVEYIQNRTNKSGKT